MTICFFGTYNAAYGRTSTLREGLIRLGVTVLEMNEAVTNIRMELPEDYTLKTTLFRIGRKVKSLLRLARRVGEITTADCIVVLHPGHVDLPLAWMIAKIWGKKLIFDDGLSPYDTMFVGRTIADRSSGKARLVKAIESFLLTLPDKVLVDTELMKEFLHRELHVPLRKLFVVPLGANDTLYKPKKQNGKKEGVDVLFFGLYNPMHGAPIILEAATILKKESNIHFTMLGDGYLKDDLVAFAKKNTLRNVTFVGLMPETELVKRIQEADIILGVFSKSPVFERVIPNKVFGALACQKALITADRPAVSDLLTNRVDACLVPPEDPQALADAIKRFAGSGKNREDIARRGFELYRNTATPEKVAEQFLKHGVGV